MWYRCRVRVLAALILVGGCSAIDDFGAFKFAALDGGGEAGRDGAPAPGDGALPDLMTVACTTGECCPGVACPAGGCCTIDGHCLPSGDQPSPGMVCLGGVAVACGAHAQPCCHGNTCASDGCCVGGRCVASTPVPELCGQIGATQGTCMGGACVATVGSTRCGGVGDPCCPGGGTAGAFCSESGAVCVGTTCQACVLIGGPYCCGGGDCGAGGSCCLDNLQCAGLMASCGSLGGKCRAGGCGTDLSGCGAADQQCCAGSVCTQARTVCAGNLCVACGGGLQPCCPGSFCAEPYVCDQMVCHHCGDLGELCCAGNACNGALRCSNGGKCGP